MPNEQLTESLQESVLAVLTFNQEYGALISSQVTPENFDGIFNEVAAPVLAYWRKYRRAPGEAHLESLFSRAKLDPSDRRTHALRRALFNLHTMSEGLNPEYIANRTQDHVRAQKLKTALLQANERYAEGGDEAVAEVEGILHKALRYRQSTLDAGISLNQIERLPIFSGRQEESYLLGIPELDKYHIGPVPKQLLLYIAPKNTGKSWFCVHVGRQCLLQKAKVLHVTLEMPEDDVLERYYQSFFAIASYNEAFKKSILEFDELDRLTGFRARSAKPKVAFTDPKIKAYLRGKLKAWNDRFKRLKIKEFSSGSLTMRGLEGYLDYLELTENFVPNVLVMDYPDLMSIDQRDFRISLGRTFVGLRGLGGERNMAMVAPTQGGRDSIGAKMVTSKNVTEDISKVFTADKVLTYSQTAPEYDLGLARLRVEHARKAPKHQQVLLTQSYATGQYVLQSTSLNSSYWSTLQDLTGETPETGE